LFSIPFHKQKNRSCSEAIKSEDSRFINISQSLSYAGFAAFSGDRPDQVQRVVSQARLHAGRP